MLQPEIIRILTLMLGLFVVVFFFIKNDELPFIIFMFFYTAGLRRYELIIEGRTSWVRVAYSKGVNFFTMNNELGLQALNLFFMGTSLFMLSYMIFRLSFTSPASQNIEQKDTPDLFTRFFAGKKKVVILLFILFFALSGLGRASLQSSTTGIAHGNSYAFLFGMASGGLVLLMYLVFKSITFKRQGMAKLVFGFMLLVMMYLSYNPTTRFQFISWVVALGIITVKQMKPFKKTQIYLLGGSVLFIIFSLAGVSRMTNLSHLSFSEKITMALERGNDADDQNMLDGMIMIMQVYPNLLKYHYGTEHLEFLVRPIPRSIWPGKPVGGYVNKLGLNDNMKGASVGISPSIYGSFFGEGGVIGIAIFSILYGFVFCRIIMHSEKYGSDMRWLIKGITLSCLIPLLRGGDLPGIFAFMIMTFWPVFLLQYQYGIFRNNEKKIERRKKKQLLFARQNQLA